MIIRTLLSRPPLLFRAVLAGSHFRIRQPAVYGRKQPSCESVELTDKIPRCSWKGLGRGTWKRLDRWRHLAAPVFLTSAVLWCWPLVSRLFSRMFPINGRDRCRVATQFKRTCDLTSGSTDWWWWITKQSALGLSMRSGASPGFCTGIDASKQARRGIRGLEPSAVPSRIELKLKYRFRLAKGFKVNRNFSCSLEEHFQRSHSFTRQPHLRLMAYFDFWVRGLRLCPHLKSSEIILLNRQTDDFVFRSHAEYLNFRKRGSAFLKL